MIRIFNTLSGKKEPLVPLIKNHIRMYVCGVTVYDLCHLGHARCEVAFDVVHRYFLAKQYKVTFVRNVTDVDDKIIKRAKKNNESIEKLAENMIHEMHQDYQSLGVLLPSHEPRASHYISEMIHLISILLEKGYAYRTKNNDIYYRVKKYNGYGKLSGKKIEDLTSGVRIDVDPLKEDALDFALWKSVNNDDPSWPSPWGDGRPGWHIECSAMCQTLLGDSFDIHGGGMDLKFPHHENEIAQSEAATGKPYASIWMHVGSLQINDEKMSKSLGNFLTVKDVLLHHSPEVVRYFLISSHYRSYINYTKLSLIEANERLERMYNALRDIDLNGIESEENTIYEKNFYEAMDDDLNTPKALSVLFELVRSINIFKKNHVMKAKKHAALLVKLGQVLGILQQNPLTYLQSSAEKIDVQWIEEMIQQRAKAKENKDFKEADRIRLLLDEAGIHLLDTREKTTWQKKK